MAVRVSSSGPRGAKTYEIRWKNGELYDYTDNATAAKRIAAKARKEERAYYGQGKRNPGKKPSKLQRLMASTKRAKQKRMAKALNEYLKVRNPGTKLAGAKVIKNAGGSITIIPIKLRRAK